MAQDQLGLAKLSDDDQGEQFMIMLVDGKKVGQHGYFMTTLDPTNEIDTRAKLATMGTAEWMIDAMIARARNHYSKEQSERAS